MASAVYATSLDAAYVLSSGGLVRVYDLPLVRAEKAYGWWTGMLCG
jgi:hypothetical protein